MAKTNIGAALGALVNSSLDDKGLQLAARIACHLSDLAPGSVRSIDSDLSFSIKAIGLHPAHGVTVAQRINYRRASTLIQKTVQPRTASPANFEANDHMDYIGKAKAATASFPVRPGHYLGGSYWAYSEHNDRVRTRTGWGEALELLKAGIEVAKSVDHATASANIFRRWFGDAPQATVLQALKNTLAGMTTTCTGIGYAHTPTQGNTLKLIETGFSGSGGAESVKPDDNAWGTAQGSKKGFMCLGVKFFNDAETSGQPTALHGLTDLQATEISRGGAILHESTHLFAGTHDVPLGTIENWGNLFARVGVMQPTQKSNLTEKAYGPRICSEVARLSGAAAAKNADNYRLFCEDAFTL
jgi:hypothetical protein